MKNSYQKGFTLVEVLIVLLLGGLIIAGVYKFFNLQQASYINQEEIAEMQQELRATLEVMSREIRNAGHDKTWAKSLGAGFRAAPFVVQTGPAAIHFTMDIASPAASAKPYLPNDLLGDPNEDVGFALIGAGGLPDANGIADSGVADLGRDTGAGLQPLGSNIHAIGFAYARKGVAATGALLSKVIAGQNYVVWAVPDGAGAWIDLDNKGAGGGPADGIIDINDDAGPGGAADAIQLTDIRAVRIWILARASRPDPKYSDTNTYKVGVNVIPPPNDNFRRRSLTTNVRCRNMGIPATN